MAKLVPASQMERELRDQGLRGEKLQKALAKFQKRIRRDLQRPDVQEEIAKGVVQDAVMVINGKEYSVTAVK